MEIFKDIIGYEGYYQISNLGRVKSSYKKCSILKSPKCKSGYKTVNLYRDKKLKNCYLHRLIAITFIPNPENKPYVNHIDGNKLNNDLNNLEWCNGSHNVKEAFRLKLKNNPKGSENKRSKKVINTITNEVYDSLEDASKKLGIKKNKLSYHLNSKNNTLSHLSFLDYNQVLTILKTK